MPRIPGQCAASSLHTAATRPHFQKPLVKRRFLRTIFTSTPCLQDGSKPESGDTVSKEPKIQDPSEVAEKQAVAVKALTETAASHKDLSSNEKLVKKFKLKPSAEVGIRARTQEKERRQAQEEAARKATEAESRAGADKINRLFEKLQLGVNGASTEGSIASDSTSTQSKKVSESWKFLFDEDDLGEKKTGEGPREDKKDMLDRIPGASDLFPTVSEHRSQASNPLSASGVEQRPAIADRWKDPKMKSTERDAFKALFSSLFEQKKPQQEATPGEKVQSLFSNFSRTGLERTKDSAQASGSTAQSLFGDQAPPVDASTTSPSTNEGPMQVLRRQLENLSKRVEPIYLDRKPSTPSFAVMKNTVGQQDWLSKDPTMPQESSLFTAIRDENKVAIRMRKELEEKRQDVVKVKEFVDELLAPYVQPSLVDSVKPSSVSLDGLLSQAILAVSSTRLEGLKLSEPLEEMPSAGDRQSLRSLHPLMGHAFVEHARRQGLPVFIRTVRTESYKALIKSRWDAWHDGPGCLELLKEMQRSGALVDSETKSIVRAMRKDLKTSSSVSLFMDPLAIATSKERLQQYGWGDEEQAAPIVEMLNIIAVAQEDGDSEYNMKQWAKRSQWSPSSPA